MNKGQKAVHKVQQWWNIWLETKHLLQWLTDVNKQNILCLQQAWWCEKQVAAKTSIDICVNIAECQSEIPGLGLGVGLGIDHFVSIVSSCCLDIFSLPLRLLASVFKSSIAKFSKIVAYTLN